MKVTAVLYGAVRLARVCAPEGLGTCFVDLGANETRLLERFSRMHERGKEDSPIKTGAADAVNPH